MAGLNRRTPSSPEAPAVEAVEPVEPIEPIEAAEVVDAAGSAEAAEAVAPDAPEVPDVQEPASEEAELKAPEAVVWNPSPTPKKTPRAAAKAEPVEDPEPKQPAKFNWPLPVALVVVGLLLGGLATFFLVKSRSVSYDEALVDAGATSEVNGQIREAVEKSFSYNFADVESTEKAAKELLTGKALCQYNAVFGPVKEVAPQQKLVVTVRVVSSAVSSLKDGHATVLVFADQVTTRTTDNQTGGGTAMLRVSAVDDGGRWKIDNMEMFGATADQNRQLQGC
ncbi:hypothetical protein [Lentzea sp. NBRC 102530]|uniref:hypothetical protein n=1 Tax=Lentzea sp. NBRC 102530 TaxID=3032201 RepID=UPI0024A044D6|nr:hypothetical protein [Lentzea sp. NBRC 102530]GLY52207.1 hypothetical protein Lesp01_58630 [Lentzea sp. NBRC 102530]